MNPMDVESEMVVNQEKSVDDGKDENDNGRGKATKTNVVNKSLDKAKDVVDSKGLVTSNGDVRLDVEKQISGEKDCKYELKDEPMEVEPSHKSAGVENGEKMEIDECVDEIVVNEKVKSGSENIVDSKAKENGEIVVDKLITTKDSQPMEDAEENLEDDIELRKKAEENEQKEAEILEKLNKVDAADQTNTQDSKEQTIIITETKSLAKAINEAVKKPDGKPTLVIIESKPNSNSGSSSIPTPTTPTGSKSNKQANSPSTSMTLRSRSRMEAQTHSSGGSSSSAAQLKALNKQKSENANVALKDDADINIYTPSLMVPYLYECPPKQKLAQFLDKIGALVKKVEEEKKEVDEEVEIQNGEHPKKEKTYFDSALGIFFSDIGLLQAQRWVQSDVLRSEKRKLDKGWSTKERKSMVFSLNKTLENIKNQVQQFQFKLKVCTRCDFKTESQTVMDRHLETIHVVGNKMICSYCEFVTIEPSLIFQHLCNSHKAFGRLERPLALHQCPMCPVEDSAKARVTRHMWKCAKNFVPEKNQAPSNDFEPPAKRVRHVATVANLKAMRAGASVDKMSSAAALTTNQIYQMQQSRSSLTGHGAQRPQPPPIRPKPGDIRLTPAYVQSVLRGQYMSSTNVRGLSPSAVSGSQVRAAASQRLTNTTTTGAYMLRPSNPVITSINTLTNPLQASQLFQVINPSTAGGLVPLVRGGTIGGMNAQRFTILPTTPVAANNRGPTPVALIPNLVTTSKTTASIPTGMSAAAVRGTNQSTNVSGANRSGSQKPNISITPVNKTAVPNKWTSTSKTSLGSGSSTSSPAGATQSPRIPNINQTQHQGGGGGGGNSTYVVCEICDGYIKDLDQLRNHMQWIHKVKIHPKMIHNRPPLNCQKCHFRFFTDQGLERHLLGSHGLVTSSMQENANKGKDGGRCIICGKVFLWKLVVHMAKDHKMTLKPAHLSYKCTVCSATFNMYRLFETHVYDEHSTVAKRVLDGQKSVSGASSFHAPTSTKVNTHSNQTNSAPQQPARRSEPTANAVSTPTTTTSKPAVEKSSSSTTTPSVIPTTAVAATPVGGAAASSAKPATSRITLHPEPRVCDDCGTTFKRGGNCDRHWEPTKLKPCNANLCRVDKCDSCLDKNAAVTVVNKSLNLSTSVLPAATTEATSKMASPKVAAQKSPANGKAGSEKAATKEKVAPKIQPEKEKQQTKVQSPSDGEDVFDMEVETVDENGSSPGYARSDVESD